MKNDYVKSYFYLEDNKLFRTSIVDDPEPDDPRQWSNVGTMITSHPRYSLGDEQVKDIAEDWEDYFYRQLVDYKEPSDTANLSLSELKQKWMDSKYMVLPINLYDHSGLSISVDGTGNFDRWDSSHLGFIYIDKDNKELLAYQETHTPEQTKEWAKDILTCEVNTYNQYLTGFCFGVEQAVYNDKLKDFEPIESIWGFYPNENLTIDEMYKDIVLDSGFLSKSDELLTEEQVFAWQNEPQRIITDFFKEASKQLPDFENNPVLAYNAVNLLWKETRPSDIKTVSQYVNENSKNRSDFNFLLFKDMNMSVNHSNFANIACMLLEPSEIDNWQSDLYLKKNEKTELLFERYNDNDLPLETLKNVGSVSVFIDNKDNIPFYEFKSCCEPDIMKTYYLNHKFEQDNYIKHFGTKEEKINLMFNNIYSSEAFKDSNYENMNDYINHFIIPAGYDSKKGENWWKAAIDHAVSSGGSFWLNDYQKLAEQIHAGLENPSKQNFTQMSDGAFEKVLSKASSNYSEYFFEYLKNNKYINPAVSPNMTPLEKSRAEETGRGL